MRCICGFENVGGARFCGKCGSPLGEAPAPPPRSRVAEKAGPAASHGSFPARLRVGLFLIVAAGLAAGYWWVNRPPAASDADNSGLYPISLNGKVGFMDRAGKTVIPPQFDEARDFSEGRAAVRLGAKYGFIVTTGAMTITPQWDDVRDFRQRRAAVKICCGPWSNQSAGDRYGIIDENGKYIGVPNFLWMGSQYSDNLLPVKTPEGKFAFVDWTGKVAISGSFDAVSDFVDGLAPALAGGQWGFVGTSGQWEINPQFELAMPFSEGLAGVQVGGRVGYIDRKGAFVVNPRFDLVPVAFHEGRAMVFVGSTRGFIDNGGNVVVEPQFVNALNFSDGLAAVQTEQGWGFVDRGGKIVIPPQFDAVAGFDRGFGFQNGLARVVALGKEAYITKTGAFVVDPFPGTTVLAEKSRVAAEAAKASEREPAADTAIDDNTPQVPMPITQAPDLRTGDQRLSPEFVSGHLDRAEGLFSRQQYDAAIAECDLVLSRQPGNSRASDLRARIAETKRILGK